MVNIKKFSREYGHGRANYINGPRVAGARSLPAKSDQGLKTAGYVWYFHDHKWKYRYDPSVKRQVTSIKHHAPIFRKQQASSVKLSNQPVQSPSGKHQAQSNKRQASSRK